MTREDYSKTITEDILYRMAKFVANHNRCFVPSSITKEFYLVDLKNSIIPGDCNSHPYQVILNGHSIEIRMKDKWPITLFYRHGMIILGKYAISIDCYERAVEDLRFLTKVLPSYADEYVAAMEKASMEIKKDKVIRDIYEASVVPALAETMDGRGVTCETRRCEKVVAIDLLESGCKVRTFYIPYNNFQEGIDKVKEFIITNFALNTEGIITASVTN